MTTTYKQYVNLDPRNADERGDVEEERAGPFVTARAKLDTGGKAVEVQFTLVPGANNAMKALDETDPVFKIAQQRGRPRPGFAFTPGRTSMIVMSDAEGNAEIDLTLSECGGDEFTVKAHPVQVPSDVWEVKYQVWRRLYIHPRRMGFTEEGSSPVKPLDLADTQKELLAKDRNIELKILDEAQVQGTADFGMPPLPDDVPQYAKEQVAREWHEAWNRIVDRERDAVPEMLPRSDVSLVLLLPLHIADYSTKFASRTCSPGESAEPIALPVLPAVKPAVRWMWTGTNGAPTLLDPSVVVWKGDQSVSIQYDKWGTPPSSTAKLYLQVDCLVIEAKSLSGRTDGLSSRNLIWVTQGQGNAEMTPAARTLVAIHELGHAIGMVPEEQTTHYEDHGHLGPHCSTGVSDLDADDYEGGTCVMFGASSPSQTSQFCDACHPSLRASTVRTGL